MIILATNVHVIHSFFLYAVLIKVYRCKLEGDQYARLISGDGFAKLWHAFITNVVICFLFVFLVFTISNPNSRQIMEGELSCAI